MANQESKTDEALVMAYQTGDRTALTLLVKRWHKQFCNTSFWIVKDADVAKDVAQDSWQTIILKMDDLNKPGSFKSWALRIVRNKSMDVLRTDLRSITKKEKYKVEQENQLIENEDVSENDTIKQKLGEAIKNLPYEQHSVVKLFYHEEYTLKEIAQLMQISVGTVKSRLFHAREKLKKTLKSYNYEN